MSVDDGKRAGYNWRSVLADFATTSARLCGYDRVATEEW